MANVFDIVTVQTTQDAHVLADRTGWFSRSRGATMEDAEYLYDPSVILSKRICGISDGEGRIVRNYGGSVSVASDSRWHVEIVLMDCGDHSMAAVYAIGDPDNKHGEYLPLSKIVRSQLVCDLLE